MNREAIENSNYYHTVIVPHWQKIIANEWGEKWTEKQTDRMLKKYHGAAKVDAVFLEACRRLAFDFFNYNIPRT